MKKADFTKIDLEKITIPGLDPNSQDLLTILRRSWMIRITLIIVIIVIALLVALPYLNYTP